MDRCPARGASRLRPILHALTVLLLTGYSTGWAIQEDPRLQALEIPLPSRTAPPATIDLRAGEMTGAPYSLPPGTAWQGKWDPDEKRIDRLMPQSWNIARPGDEGPVVDASIREFLAGHPDLFGASLGDLRTTRIIRRGGVWWVTYQQTFDGLPVLDARLDLRLDLNGNLLMVRDRTIRGLAVPDRRLTTGEAEQRAASDLQDRGLAVAGVAAPIEGIDECGPSSEVIVSIWDDALGKYAARRAFRVRHEVTAPMRARFRSYVDATDGRLLARTNELAFAPCRRNGPG